MTVPAEVSESQPAHRARLFVVSGPSGVGKGSVIAEVLRGRPDLWLSVSTTTRKPREGEVDGRDYFFTTLSAFDQAVDRGEFLEHATYAGNRYGTSRTPVRERLESGHSVILEIDLLGARQVRQADPDAVLVMIAPPSREELEARLRGRGTEAEEDLASRLEAADTELAAADEFDHVLVNERILATAQELVQLMDRHQGEPLRDRPGSTPSGTADD